MGLSPVMELLEDPNLDLRVIQLVRDPRGALHSRMQVTFINSIILENNNIKKSCYINLNINFNTKIVL